MNKYPKYKPSGIVWIGEIPEHWSIYRVKNAFNRKKEKAFQNDPTILSLTSRGVIERDITYNEGQIAESYFEYNPVDVGDLLLNPMDLVTNAFAAVSKLKGVISPAYFNLVHKNKINSKYFEYYFKLQYWNKSFFSHGKGVSIEHRWTLNQETLMNFPIPLPNAEEQTAIANFLDKKTAQIDELISNKQKLIDLLKEERTAIINQAVTKGINPNVKLKPSGIEWLGDIPEHWDCLKIKRRVNKITDGEHISPEFLSYGIPFLSAKDVRDREISLDVDKFVSEEDAIKFRNRCCPNKGDLLIVSRGATIGRIALIETEKIFCLLGSVILIKPDVHKISSIYLYYLLTSDIMQKQFWLLSASSAQQAIYIINVQELFIPLPSLSEQNKIEKYLEEENNRIKTIITKVEKEIELLQKYRTALISEAVTGKIKVV